MIKLKNLLTEKHTWPDTEEKYQDDITEGKADKSFTKIINLLRKESRKLNDDDSYELSTKLKAWFNKNVM